MVFETEQGLKVALLDRAKNANLDLEVANALLPAFLPALRFPDTKRIGHVDDDLLERYKVVVPRFKWVIRNDEWHQRRRSSQVE